MKQEALKDLLDAVEAAIKAGDWKVDGACDPDLAVRRAKQALANVATEDTSKESVDEMQKQRHEANVQKFLGAPQSKEQEPVQWGVDWGKAGDIPCVSIIKRLPDGGIKVMAVEYAPYSYTTPPQRTWVGLTNNDLQPIAEEYRILFGSWVHDFARAIEAKLKEKNT